MTLLDWIALLSAGCVCVRGRGSCGFFVGVCGERPRVAMRCVRTRRVSSAAVLYSVIGTKNSEIEHSIDTAQRATALDQTALSQPSN